MYTKLTNDSKAMKNGTMAEIKAHLSRLMNKKTEIQTIQSRSK